jgi:hypothetical protein
VTVSVGQVHAADVSPCNSCGEGGGLVSPRGLRQDHIRAVSVIEEPLVALIVGLQLAARLDEVPR